MLALQGYYAGQKVQALETIQARKNQKVIITVLDEFIEETSGDGKEICRCLIRNLKIDWRYLIRFALYIKQCVFLRDISSLNENPNPPTILGRIESAISPYRAKNKQPLVNRDCEQ